MPARLTLPNVITCGNVTAGFLALVALDRGQVLSALVLVVVAAVCDVLDGMVARRGSGETAFGSNLDSLADVLSFGVVPAFALYVGPLQPLSGIGTAGCLTFLIAGAWRLARYPLVKGFASFVGLPIPLAGVLAMLLVVSGAPSVLALALAVVLAVLMVSTVPCPTVAAAARWLSGVRRLGRRSARGNDRSDGRGGKSNRRPVRMPVGSARDRLLRARGYGGPARVGRREQRAGQGERRGPVRAQAGRNGSHARHRAGAEHQ